MKGSEQYTPEATSACEMTLRTLIAKIGRWGPQIVVVGGLVPRYLVKPVPTDVAPHVGTTDIDVVIGVIVPDDDQPLYATLEKKLVEAGFHPEESFRWTRKIDGITVILEFFCPVGDGPPGRLKRRPENRTGSGVSAIRLRGAELVGRDCIEISLVGQTLDHGGNRAVDVKVANLLPFLVLKAFALDGRDKDKDAYDIVWTLNAFADGPATAAAYAIKSPVALDSEVGAAMDILRRHFQTLDAAGPSLYARFLANDGGDADGRRALQRFTSTTVGEFLDAWESVSQG